MSSWTHQSFLITPNTLPWVLFKGIKEWEITVLRWNIWMFTYETNSNLFINTLYLLISAIKTQVKKFKYLMSNQSFLSQAVPINAFLFWNGRLCAYSLMINSLHTAFSFLKWTHISNKLHASFPTVLKRNSQAEENKSVTLNHKPVS